MEALGIPLEEMTDPSATDSGTEDNASEIVDAIIVETPEDERPPEAATKRSRSRAKPAASKAAPREAKAGPPSLDEWTGFFSRVVLRVVCDWYLSWAMRGIDEDALSEREVERLILTDDEKQTIAVPFAELSNKSKIMRRHGRLIVSSGDSLNALIVLGAWFSRVNRIAAKHRPRVVKGQTVNGSPRQGAENGSYPEGANGGRVPPGWRVFPGPG